MHFHTGGSYPYLILLAKFVPYLLNFGMEHMASNDMKNAEKYLVKL